MIWGRILGFFTSTVGKYFGYAALAVGFVGTVFAAGRRDARKDQKVDNLQDLVDTQVRMNETYINDTVGAATNRLRQHGQIRD